MTKNNSKIRNNPKTNLKNLDLVKSEISQTNTKIDEKTEIKETSLKEKQQFSPLVIAVIAIVGTLLLLILTVVIFSTVALGSKKTSITSAKTSSSISSSSSSVVSSAAGVSSVVSSAAGVSSVVSSAAVSVNSVVAEDDVVIDSPENIDKYQEEPSEEISEELSEEPDTQEPEPADE